MAECLHVEKDQNNDMAMYMRWGRGVWPPYVYQGYIEPPKAARGHIARF